MSYRVVFYKKPIVVDPIDLDLRSDDEDLDDFCQTGEDDLPKLSKDIEKNSVIFPNRKLAELYAKNISGAFIEECDIDVPDIEVKKIKSGQFSNNIINIEDSVMGGMSHRRNGTSKRIENLYCKSIRN